jgi:hypothetical protein
MRLKLWRALGSAAGDHRGVRLALETFREFRGWTVLEDARGLPFPSFEAFCKAPPPCGLGVTRRQVEEWAALFAWARTARAQAADPEVRRIVGHGGNRRNAKIRKHQSDNVTLIRGNRAEYLVRRLKCDAPEIAHQLADGRFRSARAAAIAAGPPRSIGSVKRGGGRRRRSAVAFARRSAWIDLGGESARPDLGLR